MNSSFMTDEDYQIKFDEIAAELTDLQRNFAQHLASGMSQRKAYVAAGGTAKKETVQDTQASMMFRKPKVKELHKLIVLKAMEESVMTRTESMMILSDIARARIDDFMTYEFYEHEDPKTSEITLKVKYNAKNSEDIPSNLMNAVAGVTMTPSGPRFTLRDATAAHKQLAKMLDWDSPTKITTPEDQPFTVKGAVDVKSEEVVKAIEDLMSKF